MRWPLLFLLFATSALQAQEPLCLVKKYGVEDGLLHRRVSAITQDREGFLWVGTPAGLHRFDGYTFKTYTTTDGLANNAIDAIWTDADGLLWLVRGGGRADQQALSIDIVDPHTGVIEAFDEHFANTAPLRASELLPASCTLADSTLVIGATGRLVRYHPRTGFTLVPLTDELEFRPEVATLSGTWGTCDVGGAHRCMAVRQGGAQALTDTALAGDRIYWSIAGNAFSVDNTFEQCGRYVFVSHKEGFAAEYWLPSSGAARRIRGEQDAGDWDSMIRMALGDGLWLVNATVRRMQPGDDPVTAPIVFDLAERFPDVDFRLFAAYRDRNDHIWIGGEFGLYQLQLHPNPFQRLLWKASIPRGHGNRIRGLGLRDSLLLVTTEKEGRWMLNARNGEVLFADTSALLRYALSPDGKDGWWSHEDDSVIHLDAVGNRLPGSIDAADHFVWSVLPLNDDTLLLGTTDGIGIADSRTRRFTQLAEGHGSILQGATVVDLVRDRSGTIWASTSVGLFNISAQGHLTARWWSGARAAGDSTHFLPAIDFRHFRQDRDGIIWLATADAGLLRWDRATGDVRTVNHADGLPNNSVYASYADDMGQVWLPTDNGIVRYDPGSGSVTSYTTVEGITHNEFNRLAHAQGPDGRLYFGGLNGITAFDPRTLRDMHPGNGAPLVITGARQFQGALGREVELRDVARNGTGIVMQPGDRYFSVSMALLSFEEPARISYAWRIDGVDSDWNYQHEPSLRIAALPYGEHLLRIKAQGGNGVWTDELHIPVDIVRPFYLRWWFITLCIVATVGILTLFLRARILARAQGDDEDQ